MENRYVNHACIDGNCPLLVEETRYGNIISKCEDYCGSGFHGCNNCYFKETEMCNECVHKG